MNLTRQAIEERMEYEFDNKDNLTEQQYIVACDNLAQQMEGVEVWKNACAQVGWRRKTDADIVERFGGYSDMCARELERRDFYRINEKLRVGLMVRCMQENIEYFDCIRPTTGQVYRIHRRREHDTTTEMYDEACYRVPETSPVYQSLFENGELKLVDRRLPMPIIGVHKISLPNYIEPLLISLNEYPDDIDIDTEILWLYSEEEEKWCVTSFRKFMEDVNPEQSEHPDIAEIVDHLAGLHLAAEDNNYHSHNTRYSKRVRSALTSKLRKDLLAIYAQKGLERTLAAHHHRMEQPPPEEETITLNYDGFTVDVTNFRTD